MPPQSGLWENLSGIFLISENLGRIVEGLWNLNLEKPLNIQSLVKYCGNLEDNGENRVGRWWRPSLWSFRGKFDSPVKTLIYLMCELRISDSGQLGQKNQLWLPRDQDH